ncbi:Non-reducing end beta-L-arabinofuranosidase [mine drainage metagenome]|uniref:Non-reducing end beta-L-arabinofuranosidase n=1 Tax=mine drainage metagenome TaxID=410659 RepID=A0A1J5S6M3_9ZZZZ
MRPPFALYLLAALSGFSLSASAATDYPVRPVPFTDVRLTGGFWGVRQEVNREVTLPYAMDQCEASDRLKNFDLAAETLRRRAAGDVHFQNKPATIFPFDDTDAYKVIEAASYVLSMHPDPALSRRVDGWIARIAAAQEPDGYLYTFRTMHPDSPAQPWVGQRRWENEPKLSHELYDAGHLYEAGVAHYLATGKRTLLDVCLKNANLLWRTFGDGRLRVAPGHEIVEMGLVKLYRVTGDERWLKLAKIFLDARGPGGPAYSQQQALVVDQTEAVGHAVRANYLYSGMADVAALTGDQRYQHAIDLIWRNVVSKKLYLTGGVGALRDGEAYGADYQLPNDAYNETCAAVALMMWNHRMFLRSGDARYMDVVERTAYNGFISGVSLSGNRFFYPNPLVYDGHSKNNYGCAGRAPWFGCACCPPNLMRLLASLGGYFYAVKGDDLYVNLYSPDTASVKLPAGAVTLTQDTQYPWKGRVRLTVDPAKPAEFALRLRVPGWARGEPVPSDLYTFENPGATQRWTILVNGSPVDAPLDHGYAVLSRIWKAGDVVELDLPMPVRRVLGNAHIEATRGRVAFERGPVVYCVEDTAHGPTPPDALVVNDRAPVTSRFDPSLLGGVTVLELSVKQAAAPVMAIPYYTWDNRGLSPMAVWLDRADR